MYGIEIRNKYDDSLVVSSEYPSLVFVGKAQQRNNGVIADDMIWEISGLPSTATPAVFVHTNNSAPYMSTGLKYMGGNLWEIYLQHPYQNPNNFEVYVFCSIKDYPGIADPNDNYGIDLFDSNGNLTFSSRAKPLGISKVITCSSDNAADRTVSVAVAKPAIMMNPTHSLSVPGPEPGIFSTLFASAYTGTYSVSFTMRHYTFIPAAIGEVYNQIVYVPVIDAANYD